MGIHEKRPRKGLHICAVLLEIASVRSRPTRARGLKQKNGGNDWYASHVAPHAGAWIETNGYRSAQTPSEVAPHAGAWIETRFSSIHARVMSVAPHAGAWIETTKVAAIPIWPHVAPHAGAWIETLKPEVGSLADYVAPHAGAWIETAPLMLSPVNVPRRAPRGRVD